jgi:hypothetical protein
LKKIKLTKNKSNALFLHLTSCSGAELRHHGILVPISTLKIFLKDVLISVGNLAYIDNCCSTYLEESFWEITLSDLRPLESVFSVPASLPEVAK